MRTGSVAVGITIVSLVIALGSGTLASVAPRPSAQVAAAGSCGLSQPAFCETFDAPAGTGNRSGDLNGTLWGVSRTGQDTNPTQAALDVWAPVTLAACGSPTVTPDADVKLCGGRLVEGVNDDGGFTVLAAYPKQPFDWAGRSGVVGFDVDLNASGPHGSWPAFAITNLPVPAPSGADTTQASHAQYQLGFSLATQCGAGSACGEQCAYTTTTVGVDRIYLVNNYQYQEVSFTPLGCVESRPGTPNHVEVHVSQSRITIWATPPGGGALTELADSGPVSVPFTRGLIWLEDVHYNAAKFGGSASATFQWDNVGFDGPVLPRDLTFDVADALTPAAAGGGRVNLGYAVDNASPTTLAVNGLADPGTAQQALLTLNLFPLEAQSFQYQLNGGAWHDSGWPFGPAAAYQWNTMALPVALSELHAGQNHIALKLNAADTWVVANLDIILVGAGGTGSAAPGNVTLVAPPEGSTTVSTTPTLSWNAASNSTSSTQYTAYIWDPNPGSMVFQQTTSGLSVAVPAGAALQAGRFYYYSAQACTGSACGPLARWEGFTTQAGLGAPGLTSPLEGATGVSRTPTLQWTAASGASAGTQYTGFIWDPAANAMAFQQRTSGLSVSVPAGSPLLAGHFYYYSAQACTGNACGPLARWEGFTTASGLGAPGLTSPPEGATGVSRTPTLRWTAASGAGASTQYTGFVWDPTANAMAWQGSTSGLSVSVPAGSALLAGHFYYYSAQACSGSDCGPLARWEGFTTQ